MQILRTNINSIREIIIHEDEYIVIEKRNGKDLEHYVPKHNVEVLKKILKKEVEIGEEVSYYFMVSELVRKERLHETLGIKRDTLIDYFNGGMNRKHYFRHYYYPLKVLQAFGEIEHTKKGNVKRLFR